MTTNKNNNNGNLLPLLLVTLLLFIITTVSSASSINTKNTKLDQDSSDTDCSALVPRNNCIRDETTYFTCPISCSKYYQNKLLQEDPSTSLMVQVEMKDSSSFYDLETTNARGKQVSLDRFEGSVTLLAVVPLLKGMGQYSVAMLESIQSKHPYTLEVIVLPVFEQDYPAHKMVQLQFSSQKKIQIWETIDDPHWHSVLKFLEKKIAYNTKKFSEYPVDVLTCYIISGTTIDKRLSPTMRDLEKAVKHYVKKFDDL